MDSVIKGKVIPASASGCQTIPQDSLIASYLLQGTAEDETGTYDGTETGSVTYEYDDDRGIGLRLNADSEWITISGEILDLDGDFTISAWINPSAIGLTSAIYCQRDSNNEGIGFFVNQTTNKVGIVIENTATTQLYAYSDTAVTVGIWYHCVARKTGTSVMVTLDKVNGTPTTVSGTFGDTSVDSYLGRYQNTINTSARHLSSCYHFYSRAITDQEITDIYDLEKYQHNNALDHGLIAYYPLDGNSLDNAINQEDGTDANMTYPTDSDLGVVAAFNGTSSYIQHGVASTTDFSFSVWLNFNDISGNQMVIDFGDGRALGILYGTAGEKLVWQYASVSANHIIQNTAISYDTWYHVVGIRESSSVKLYIDNVLQTGGTVADNLTSEVARFGSRNGALFFNGLLSNPRFYNRLLSEKEIDWIYDYEKPDSTECKYNSTINNPDPFEDGSGIALYKLDGNANDTTGDYDGTPTSVTYEDGVFGQAGVFNSTTSRIVTSIPAQTDFSISFFLTIDTIELMIFWGNKTDDQFNMQLNSSTLVKSYISGTAYSFTPSPTLAVDTVYHMVLTRSGSDLKIYQDGTLLGTQTVGTGSIAPDTIGGDSSSLYATKGSLGQCRVFDKAISTDEIAILANERKV